MIYWNKHEKGALKMTNINFFYICTTILALHRILINSFENSRVFQLVTPRTLAGSRCICSWFIFKNVIEHQRQNITTRTYRVHGNINDFFRKKSKYFQRCWQFYAKSDSWNLSFSNLAITWSPMAIVFNSWKTSNQIQIHMHIHVI
jgi:hypothetical protein